MATVGNNLEMKRPHCFVLGDQEDSGVNARCLTNQECPYPEECIWKLPLSEVPNLGELPTTRRLKMLREH